VGGIIHYSVNVVPANQTTYVTGRIKNVNAQAEATVTISQYGQTTTSMTTNGVVSFPNCRIGTTNVVVQMNGFTTINFRTSLTPTDTIFSGSPNTIRQVSTMVPIFATSGAGNTAQIQGTVTIENDMTNLTPELAPAGTVVSANINANDPNFQTTYLTRDGKAGSIISIAYEDAFATTTLSAAGTYTLTVPASINQLPINVVLTDVILKQRIYINNYVGAPFVNPSVDSILTTFSQTNLAGIDNTTIPSVFPVTVTIAGPPAQGSGAAATAILKASSIDAGNGFQILNPGAGYPASSNTIQVTVSGGNFDNSVTNATAASLSATSNANGEIVAITGTTGIGYRGMATLTISGGTISAVVQPNYASTIANLGATANPSDGSTINAGGSGYVSAPTARILGMGTAGYVNVTTNTTLVQNAVASINFGAIANTFSIPPVVTFDAQSVVTATAKVNGISAGQITSFSVINPGQGYDPNGTAPQVTVNALAPAGGSGVIVNAVMAAGKLSSINVLYGGSGYANNNANNHGNYPNAFTPFTNSPNVLYVTPNGSYVRDMYYGTGYRPTNIQIQ